MGVPKIVDPNEWNPGCTTAALHIPPDQAFGECEYKIIFLYTIDAVCI